MPELPEVETVRRGLEPAMEGARFTKVEVHRGDLRWPLPKDFVRRLEGNTVTGIGRRAKYLLADLSSGDVLLMHLGMSGSFHVFEENGARAGGAKPGNYYHERSQHAAHDHVVFHMSSGVIVTFNDPRRFGSMKIVPRQKLDAEPLLNRLGPEPLGNAFDAAMLARACKGKKTSLKAALLDQRVVAGLGNIYVCETLHRARLSPKRMALTIASKSGAPNERAERLVEGIKAVLQDAIKAGGSSLRDHKRTDGELGMFQHHFRVYDREGEKCPPPYPPPHAGEGREGACRGKIKRIVQNGRSTFYCPSCQK
jgi:formamidopyrimidine-DNA glycosylase